MVYTSVSHLYGPINMSLNSQKSFYSVRIRMQPFKKDWHSIKVHSEDSEGLEWTHVVPINDRTKDAVFLIYLRLPWREQRMTLLIELRLQALISMAGFGTDSGE